MPQASPTNDLFARAAGKVMDVFAERTPTGELDQAAVVIRWPGTRDDWAGKGILGDEEQLIDFAVSDDEHVTYSRMLDLLLSELPTDLTSPPHSAKVTCGGHTYRVARQGNKVGGSFMRLALVRKALVQEKTLRKKG